MKTFTKSFAILFMILLTVSCAKEEITLPVEDELSDQSALKGKLIIPDEVNFEGTTHFDIFAVKSKAVLADPSLMVLLCDAKLEREPDGSYKLHTTETFYEGELPPYREVTFDLKITPGGSVMFHWPTEWVEYGEPVGSVDYTVVDQVMEHTGAVALYGPGINKNTLQYEGKFKDGVLSVSTHFTGKHAILEGPIQYEFSLVLNEILP